MFTAFYLPLLLILVALIVRVCAIEWRGKINDPQWRRAWDWCIAVGSWCRHCCGASRSPTWCADCRSTRCPVHRHVLGLLNPYALLGGLTTLLAFLTHGAVFLSLKTADSLRDEAMLWASRLSVAMTVVAAAFLLWTQFAYGKGWTWAPVLIAAVAALATIVFTWTKSVRDGRSVRRRSPSSPRS